MGLAIYTLAEFGVVLSKGWVKCSCRRPSVILLCSAQAPPNRWSPTLSSSSSTATSSKPFTLFQYLNLKKSRTLGGVKHITTQTHCWRRNFLKNQLSNNILKIDERYYKQTLIFEEKNLLLSATLTLLIQLHQGIILLPLPVLIHTDTNTPTNWQRNIPHLSQIQ